MFLNTPRAYKVSYDPQISSLSHTSIMGRKGSCWIWPNDGKRKGSWGRVRDVLTGKGPDIHIGKLEHAWDLRQSRWSRWPEYDLQAIFNDHSKPPAKHADRKDKRYNFKTRRYEKPKLLEKPERQAWSYARWSSHRKNPYLLEYRDIHGRWFVEPDPDHGVPGSVFATPGHH